MSSAQTSHRCPPEARKYVLITAILASAMGFIDGSIVSIAVPQMRASLGGDFVQMQWVHNAYMLMLASLILIGGAAGDRFGLRRTFGFGIALFVVASQLCAIAWSAESMIAFRALQGAGAAIMVPGSMAIIGRNFPRGERGAALGIWVSASSITSALGPTLGGLLLSTGGPEAWRWIFYVNLLLGGVALLLLWWKIPTDPAKEKTPLDWFGAVVVTASLGALALGLTWLGETGHESLGLSVLLAGAMLLAMAIWWERRVQFPMINLNLFRSAEFSGVNVLTLLVWIGLGAVFFFLPMVLVTGWNYSEFYAGVIFVPFSAMIACLSPFVGKLADRYGSKPFLVVGPLISAVGYATMAWALVTMNYLWGIIPAVLVIGFSIGLMASPLSAAVMGSVDDDHTGAAAGINNMAARMSGLFAVAGLGILVSYVYRQSIAASSLAVEVQALLSEAGFGERLTGALYSISVQEVQTAAMNEALAALCLAVSASCVVGSFVGWLTQKTAAQRLESEAAG